MDGGCKFQLGGRVFCLRTFESIALSFAIFYILSPFFFMFFASMRIFLFQYLCKTVITLFACPCAHPLFYLTKAFSHYGNACFIWHSTVVAYSIQFAFGRFGSVGGWLGFDATTCEQPFHQRWSYYSILFLLLCSTKCCLSTYIHIMHQFSLAQFPILWFTDTEHSLSHRFQFIPSFCCYLQRFYV